MRARSIHSRPELVLAALLLAVSGCGRFEYTVDPGGKQESSTGSIPHLGVVTTPPGTIVAHPPQGGFRSRRFVVDQNKQGYANALFIDSVAWGRLVDVYDLDPGGASTLVHQDFVIDPGLVSDGVDFLLDQSPVTGAARLTILHPWESPEFLAAFVQIDANLQPVFDNPPGGPFFTMVPRNAAVVFKMKDLLDPETVTLTNLRVFFGDPPVVPFRGRILIDQNHGDLAVHPGDPQLTFYSSRVIVDTTISELESFQVDPPLPVNPIGLPPSLSTTDSNVQLRIPTQINPVVGQDDVLANPLGNGVSPTGNGTVDPTSPTLDVVRAVRSGGRTSVTGDPHQGFLRDDHPPRVVSDLQVLISTPPVSTNGFDEFLLQGVTFASSFCARQPARGDVLFQSGIAAEVMAAGTGQGGVFDVRVRLLVWPRNWNMTAGPLLWALTGQGPAGFASPYDPVTDAGREGCFARIFPSPAPGGGPGTGLATSSTIGLDFGEPMDAASLAAFDTLSLTRTPLPAPGNPPLSSNQYVPGFLAAGITARRFSFVPALRLAHVAGSAESYYLNLIGGPFGAVDLVGNPVEPFAEMVVSIDPAQATERNGGRVSRFTSVDEDPPIGGPAGPLPEWNGQILFDLTRGLIRPRPVVRFTALADRSQAVPGLMTPFASGVQTPLTPLGSKTHAQWRHVDLGLGLHDSSTFDLDVEGLSWAPVGGQLVVDNYSAFEMRLAHSAWAPDEFLDPATLLPGFPDSGLQHAYEDNLLDPTQVVHPPQLGYLVHPGDIFLAASGTVMLPFPLNRTIPAAEWRTYTWRDTSIQDRAGDLGGGLDPQQLYVALGVPPPTNAFYSAGEAQSVGLPLLMEFRCFPDAGAIGLNAFDVSLAVNSSTRPFFRAFSAGGFNTSGNPVLVDPDLETLANGGYSPGSNPPGQPTFGRDSVYYLGAADFVVRVSRAYSIWFSADDPSGGIFGQPSYFPAGVEPHPAHQPVGTEILVALRGTASVGNLAAETDASSLDAFGDHYFDGLAMPPAQPRHDSADANLIDGTSVSFLTPQEAQWKEDAAAIEGSYYQVRLTFVSNTVTGLSPEVSGLAMAWLE